MRRTLFAVKSFCGKERRVFGQKKMALLQERKSFFFFLQEEKRFSCKTPGSFLARRYRVQRGDRRARREDSFYIKNRIALVARTEYLLQELKWLYCKKKWLITTGANMVNNRCASGNNKTLFVTEVNNFVLKRKVYLTGEV